MIDHDSDFLNLVRFIIEGKEPPKKDKKSDAEETLAKVKKDLGVEDDGKSEGKKRDGEDSGSKKGNEDGETGEEDHPDNPESAGSPDEVPDGSEDKKDPKKEPKKLDMSKDPLKGDEPEKESKDPADSKHAHDPRGGGSGEHGDIKDPSKGKEENESEDEGESDGDEVPQNPKEDGDDVEEKPKGKNVPGKDSKKPDSSDDADAEDDEGAETSDAADGAKIGKKVGEEDPDGDEEESDNPAGPSGKVIDGTSKTQVNLTPKIKDETISENSVEYYDGLNHERKASWHYKRAGSRNASLKKGIHHDYQAQLLKRGTKDADDKQKSMAPKRLHPGPSFNHFLKKENVDMDIVDKVRASRLRTLALMEARDEMGLIEEFLNEGFLGSIPGEWFKDEHGDYHVAVMHEDGLKDYVIEKHIGFAKLKGELSHEKGVDNPGALAAYIGRKKYGKKAMAKAAKNHKAL